MLSTNLAGADREASDYACTNRTYETYEFLAAVDSVEVCHTMPAGMKS